MRRHLRSKAGRVHAPRPRWEPAIERKSVTAVAANTRRGLIDNAGDADEVRPRAGSAREGSGPLVTKPAGSWLCRADRRTTGVTSSGRRGADGSDGGVPERHPAPDPRRTRPAPRGRKNPVADP